MHLQFVAGLQHHFYTQMRVPGETDVSREHALLKSRYRTAYSSICEEGLASGKGLEPWRNPPLPVKIAFVYILTVTLKLAGSSHWTCLKWAPPTTVSISSVQRWREKGTNDQSWDCGKGSTRRQQCCQRPSWEGWLIKHHKLPQDSRL